MIAIPRSLARQLWAVFKRCVPKAHGLRVPQVEFQTGPAGLVVRLTQAEIAVEYRQPGTHDRETLCLPLSALANFEGRGQDLVTLAVGKDDLVVAHWDDSGVPQAVEYSTADCATPLDFPEPPKQFVGNPPSLLLALDEAAKTAVQEGVRFAIHCLQLLQGGFEFPWQDNVLVPRMAAFGCKELATDKPVEVGKLERLVVLRAGCWTFFLHIDTDARYPQIEQVIPKLREQKTQWRIAPEDAAFLARVLPRLPCPDGDDDRPLTVDLGEEVCLRTQSANQSRITEVVLARSSFTGPSMRICLNRQFLGRALQLGFEEIHFIDPDQALLAQDNQRSYVAMPLPAKSALAPAADALRIVSAEAQRPQPQRRTERKKPAMATPSTNGNGHGASLRRTETTPENSHLGFSHLISEAQALKETLRDACGRASRLVVALKRHRQQSRLVQSTLASLKQLQQIES